MIMTTGVYSPNMVNAASGMVPSLTNGPPVSNYYSLGVSPDLIDAINNYNNFPVISKWKLILGQLLITYPTLVTRWDELQKGSWPALTDAAPYPGIQDFPGGPVPVNTWNLTSYSSLGNAGPPDWRVPYAPQSYYNLYPDSRFQTRFVLTNARLIMGYDNPKGIDITRDLSKFAQINTICATYRTQVNEILNSSENAKILDATFTGMETLSTGNLSLIGTDFTLLGQDLRELGNLWNLSNIELQGFPSNLLKQIIDVGGLLPGLRQSLIDAGVTGTQIDQIQQKPAATAPALELQLYKIFQLITGNDLDQVKQLLDVGTSDISNLAQLLDPQKIFPKSYTTLICPVSATQTVNVYSATSVNPAISNFFVGRDKYETLRKILPPDQAAANSALSFSWQQIKNVKVIDFRSVSEIVTGVKTNTGLSAVNGLSSPVPGSVKTNVNDSLATGTGADETITLFDMIGTAAGHVHTEKFNQTVDQFNSIDFTELLRLYDLCVNVILGVYDVNYFSINPPTLTAGGSGYTSASATIDPPTGLYCQITPSFVVTVDIDPLSGDGPVSSITATDFGSGYRATDSVTITITGDGGGASATTTIGPPSFAFVQLPDGRQFQSCGNAIAGRLEALKALIYSGSGGDNSLPGPWNTVEAEAKRLVTDYPDQVSACNDYWAQMASQLNTEALNRYLAELVFDFDTAEFQDIRANSRPSILSLASSLQSFGKNTSPGGSAMFFEKTAESANLGGQSVIAAIRESSNIRDLENVGVGMDTQLSAI